jgi:hypothetical protein
MITAPMFLKRLVTRTRPIPVKRSTATYMTQQGWQRHNWFGIPEWRGYYRTRFGSFKGKIEPSTPPKLYIHNPPAALRRHSHWPCFTPRNDGWYSIHFSIVPTDWDSAILTIERLLHESFLLAKKTA